MGKPRKLWEKLRPNRAEQARRSKVINDFYDWRQDESARRQQEREHWAEIKAMKPVKGVERPIRKSPPKEVVTGTQRAVMHHSTRAQRAKADRESKLAER